MAITTAAASQQVPTTEYARLEDRIIERDQVGASQVLYGLFKQGRPVTEILRETIRIHAPYTHVPYHQRLDDGMVKFVNNDHCLLGERVSLPLRAMIAPEGMPAGQAPASPPVPKASVATGTMASSEGTSIPPCSGT